MVRSITNIILFLIIITIFIFLATSPSVHGFVTPSPQQNTVNNSPMFQNRNNVPYNLGVIPVLERQPIFITPSHVQLIDNTQNLPIDSKISVEYVPEGLKRNPIVNNLSPTSSVAASTIYEVNMEFIKPKFDPKDEKKPSGYIFDETGRRFGSMGEKFCCKAFEEFLGRQVMIHYRPAFLKNPYGRGKFKKNLELDMYDPISNIAIEYNGIQHYKYVPSMHGNLEGFEYQKVKDNFKIQRCKELGVNLIIVPYTVDDVPCSIDEKIKVGPWTTQNDLQKKKNAVIRREKMKEEKLKNYLIPRIEDIIAGRVSFEI